MKKHCITIKRSGSTTKKILNNEEITSVHTINNNHYLTTIANDDYILITIKDPNTDILIERYQIDLTK